ncbi:MAG: ComEC/Rec2 family competence protein [Verrucomicrobia bacterium]|nr:ComEC/Rec2 family competence protein [Verrucomicrobiota bacterium]
MGLSPFSGRQPLFGGALAAAAGIALADATGLGIGPSLVAFLATLAVFLWRRSNASVWAVVVAAFATLQAFALRPPSGLELERRVGPLGRAVRVVGTIIDQPRTKEESRFYRCTLQLESIRWDGQDHPCQALLAVSWPDEAPVYGDRVQIDGWLRPPERPRNPGQFDFASWLRRKGVLTELWLREASDAVVLSSGHGSALVETSAEFRRWTHDLLRLDLEREPEVAAVIASMVLGTADEAADQLAESFRQTGTFHLFAVSGFNVAILALLVQWLLQPLGLGRGKLAPAVVVPVLLFYALVTGLGASSVRATLMAAVLLTAAWSEHPARLLNSLGAAALLILAWDPQQLFGAGFQLSFLVVLALLALGDPILQRIRGLGGPDPFLPEILLPPWRQWLHRRRLEVLGLVAASLAAWLGSAPLMFWHFHTVTPVALAANLLAVPLATVILGLGLLSLLGGAFSLTWAVLINNANWGATQLLLFSVQQFAAVPGGHFHAALPRPGAPAVELTLLDLDRSSALVLRAGGETWLLGCGHRSDFDRGVRACLHARGLDRLTGLIATKPASAHTGAAEECLRLFPPRAIVDSPLAARSAFRRELHEAAARRGVPLRFLAAGQMLELTGGARLVVLHPPTQLDGPRREDQPLVLRLDTSDGRRVLLLSDAGETTERLLLARPAELRADVLILGEHPREASGTPAFLAAVQPSLVLRHERNRRFRRASDEGESQRRILRLPAATLLYKTDANGALTLSLDPGRPPRVSAFLGPPRPAAARAPEYQRTRKPERPEG